MNENSPKQLNFLGITAPKSGTTFTYQCLKEHPEIGVVSSKDGYTKSVFRTGRRHTEISAIDFGTSATVIGEFREGFYLKFNEVAPLIKEHNPHLQFILCLRNPYERAYSAYRHIFSLKNYFPSITELEAREQEFNYVLEKGYYTKYLQDFFATFPKEQFLVLLFDELQSSPANYIKRLYTFLGVSPDFVPSVLVSAKKANDTNFKTTILGRFIHTKLLPFLDRLSLGNFLRRSVTMRKIFYRFGSWYGNARTRHSRVTGPGKADFIASLGNRYDADIAKLEKLIHQDLSHWKSSN